MSVTSIASPQQQPRVEKVEFTTTDGAPHPSQLIFALAGVTAALDQLQPTFGSREDFSIVGNLGCAAHILAKQLAERLA